MEKFTKTEIGWMAIELEKQAASLKWHAENPFDKEELKLSKGYKLRSEQYADIAQRLYLALEKGDKRIEIQCMPETILEEACNKIEEGLSNE